MTDETISILLSIEDAEILLGVLSAERHNVEAATVCDAVRRQIDEKLAEPADKRAQRDQP